MNIYSTIQMILDALLKPEQEIIIDNFPAGRILDIGGGGEGVISQIRDSEVIAIDKIMSEINEAKRSSKGALWAVADGTSLPFEQASFDQATAFFSLMYIPEKLQKTVLTETQRVLRENGDFWIWDVNMPSKKKVFAIRLKVFLPGKGKIKTVYGVNAKEYTPKKLCQQLTSIGFSAKVVRMEKFWYLIKATNNHV